jgi:DNA helicase II / ATP-dependent DNA helicase PcrA
VFDAATTTTANLSTEQQTIARFAAEEKGNFLVRARAGTGKSFTIRKIVPLLAGTTAIVCFGKDPADEMKAKCAEESIVADVGTFHSFGFRALRRAYPKATVVQNSNEKFDRIAAELEIPAYLLGFVSKAMGLAMQRGFGIFFPLNDRNKWYELVAHFDLEDVIGEDNVGLQLYGIEELVKKGLQFAAKAVKLGLKLIHEIVSFDDMMYAPLVLNLRFPTFSNVLVDEAQDSNDCRREMAARMSTNRLGFVGDDMQAIMGFTGADNDALDIIKARFSCTEFPLTMTFRCCQAVVALAQQLCADYKAHPSNPQGSISSLTQEDFGKLTLVPGEDAILCRKLAPLVTTAYGLIARGVPAKVLGKDIGEGLLKLATRWQRIKTLPALRDKLEAYLAKKVTTLTDVAAERLTEKVETLYVMIDALPSTSTVADLQTQIGKLFSKRQDGTEAPVVILMTAHKSKGLEFKRVFGYGNNAWFPSRYARQPWQLAQEDHLLYVLWTRAISAYVDVVVEA